MKITIKQENNKIKRNKYAIICGIYGIIINIILSTLKLTLGFLSNSIAIMVDACNNLVDMSSSILTIIGFKLSNKNPNNKYPYGYARYEYISGFLISIFMLFTGITFAIKSISKIFNPETIVINNTMYTILTISLLIKIIQMVLFLYYSKKINSLTLKTTAIESRNDVIINISIIISMIIMKTCNINIDGYLGIFVSIIVVNSALVMSKQQIKQLVGKQINKEEILKYKNKILSYKKIKGVHEIILHNYGVYKNYMTAHIELSSKLNIKEAHEIADKIERDFKNLYNIDLTIHVDPIITKSIYKNKMKKQINNKIKELDESIIIEDFRIINKEIKFDCIIPYNKKYFPDQIKEQIYNIAKNKYELNFKIKYPL